MGILDIFSTQSSQPQNSVDKGREAFKYFHNASVGVGNYNYTMDQAIGIVASNGGSETVSDDVSTIFLDGLGGAIENIQSDGSLGGSGVQDSMEALAAKAQGQLPSSTSFFQAVGNTASNPTFLTIAAAVIPQTASQVVGGVAAIGQSIINTGSILTTLLPVVAVGAVLFIVFARTKQIAGD